MTTKTHISKKFKPTLEDRAFAYQKASELQAPVLVIMNQNKNMYSVTFIVYSNHAKLQVTAEGASVVDACMKATQAAQKKISFASYNLHDENDTERDFLIKLMRSNIKLH